MKVFALGGYGKVGLAAVKLLAQSDLVTEIAIAGRNLDRAEKATTEIGEKTVAVRADGTDEQTLTSLLAGYDIIVNAAWSSSVVPAIRAAMRAGTHYCDANVVVEQALQLASEAEAAGITAIIGSGGGSPCVTNLMGMHMASQLEEIEQLQLGITFIVDFESGRELTPGLWLRDPNESVARLHEVRQFISMMLQVVQENDLRTALDYQDDRWVEIDPVRTSLDVPLALGGTITSYTYASIDPLFGGLPGDLSRTPPAEMYFSALPPQLHELLREHALRVLEGGIDSDTAVNSFYDTVERDPQRWLTLSDDFAPIAKMWVRAVGHKEGRAARCTCWLTAPMWNVGVYSLTSVALAVAARKILRREIQERGVMTAETTFEPLPFFDEVVALLPESPPDGRLIDESFEWLE